MITLTEFRNELTTNGGIRIGRSTVHKFNNRYLVTDFEGYEHTVRTTVAAAALLNQSISLSTGKVVESRLVEVYTDIGCIAGALGLFAIVFLLWFVGCLF